MLATPLLDSILWRTCTGSQSLVQVLLKVACIYAGPYVLTLPCRKLIAIGQSDSPAVLKNLQRLPVLERFAAELFQLFVGKSVLAGADGVDSSAPILSY